MTEPTSPQQPGRERLELLFRQSQSTSIVAAFAAAATAAIIYSAKPDAAPWVWFGFVLAITVFRHLLYRRFSATPADRYDDSHWLKLHAWAAAPVGIAAGTLPLLDLAGTPVYVQELQTLVPALVAMAAITSFGIYFKQYLVLLIATGVTAVGTRAYVAGTEALPVIAMFGLFAPILALTARRYGRSLVGNMRAKQRSEQLVEQLTIANAALEHRNAALAKQQNLIEHEEALAKHVFGQLTLGGNHKLRGIHTWNQPMGNLSGDLTQTAQGPDGQAYVFLSDFTGHGLPAALGALPASSVFLAMAAKGLPVDVIASELNAKLRQLLPVGYFCCAVLLELSADRGRVHLWNGGLPPILVHREGRTDYERIESHSLPLGVVDKDEFDAGVHEIDLYPGDLLYAFTDGLTEAENQNGEMWGLSRLEAFLQRDDLPTPKLPALIDAVLHHVNDAPASDDISVLEVEVSPAVAAEADADGGRTRRAGMPRDHAA